MEAGYVHVCLRMSITYHQRRVANLQFLSVEVNRAGISGDRFV